MKTAVEERDAEQQPMLSDAAAREKVPSAAVETNGKKGPSDGSVRLAYLDNLKYASMIAIFMMHCTTEPFSYCIDAEFWKGPAPPWLGNVQWMHAQFGLPMFALASGAVANPAFSIDALKKNAAQLLLPVVFMFYWYQIIWEIIPFGKPWPTLEVQRKNLVGLHNNFLWYLKALFVWRVALMLFETALQSLGKFSSWVILVISIIGRSYQGLQDPTPEGPAFIGNTLFLFPFFMIGYMVFYKGQGNMLKPFVNFMKDQRILRACIFVAYVALWIDVAYFGIAQKHLIIKLSQYWWKSKTNRVIVTFVRIFVSLGYGFIATAWLPAEEAPGFGYGFLTDAGKQTLYTYMFNTTGILCAYNLWRYISRSHGEPIWSTWLWMQPFLVMLWSSDPIRFLTWPLVSPAGWVLKDPRTWEWEKVTDETLVKRRHPLVWLAIVFSAHALFCLTSHLWGSPRECKIG